MAKLSIRDLDLKNKRVFIRVDFNVPLAPGGQEITSDKRIKASLPSIKYALDQGAGLVLASHLGRPKGKVNPEMSLKPAAKRLGELLGKPVEVLVPERFRARHPQHRSRFFADPKIGGEALQLLGIHAVGIANNVNYGTTNVAASITRLDQIGVLHTGAGPNLAAARAPDRLTLAVTEGVTYQATPKEIRAYFDNLAETLEGEPDGAWDVLIPVKTTKSIVLKAEGVVDYYCKFHPNMIGKISVTE